MCTEFKHNQVQQNLCQSTYRKRHWSAGAWKETISQNRCEVLLKKYIPNDVPQGDKTLQSQEWTRLPPWISEKWKANSLFEIGQSTVWSLWVYVKYLLIWWFLGHKCDSVGRVEEFAQQNLARQQGCRSESHDGSPMLIYPAERTIIGSIVDG